MRFCRFDAGGEVRRGVVELEIDGVGALQNKVAEEPAGGEGESE